MCVAYAQQTIFEIVLQVVWPHPVSPVPVVEPTVVLLAFEPASGDRFQMVEDTLVAVMDLVAALAEA